MAHLDKMVIKANNLKEIPDATNNISNQHSMLMGSSSRKLIEDDQDTNREFDNKAAP